MSCESKFPSAPSESAQDQCKPTMDTAAANHGQDNTPEADLTGINSTTSPLLRLPAEIRNLVWGYAYGHRKVSVAFSPETSRPYRDFDSLVFECADELFHPPSAVSKQFYNEASGIQLSTSTLLFDNCLEFITFCIISPYKSLKRRVQNLELSNICLDHDETPMATCQHWLHSLCIIRSWIWPGFDSLTGLVMRFNVYNRLLHHFLFGTDVLLSRLWPDDGLLKLIDQVRQYKLKPEKTRIELKKVPSDSDHSMWANVDLELVAKQLRNLMLEYRPIN
ncbi:hypothetical protein PTMSG1_04911 [Pyrenophora teres f. maculata]|nr:hypothetical protein PTMSG1_04911 [Pyrenophora teres f. maculata]